MKTGWVRTRREQEEYTAIAVARKVNKERKTSFAALDVMIATLGVALVNSSLFKMYVKGIAPKVQKNLEVVGIVTTVAGIEHGLKENNDSDALDEVLNMMVSYGGIVTIITVQYECFSGSGDRKTYRLETTYRYNRY